MNYTERIKSLREDNDYNQTFVANASLPLSRFRTKENLLTLPEMILRMNDNGGKNYGKFNKGHYRTKNGIQLR